MDKNTRKTTHFSLCLVQAGRCRLHKRWRPLQTEGGNRTTENLKNSASRKGLEDFNPSAAGDHSSSERTRGNTKTRRALTSDFWRRSETRDLCRRRKKTQGEMTRKRAHQKEVHVSVFRRPDSKTLSARQSLASRNAVAGQMQSRGRKSSNRVRIAK